MTDTTFAQLCSKTKSPNSQPGASPTKASIFEGRAVGTEGTGMHWSSSRNGWKRQLRNGLMNTSFVRYFSASCCFKDVIPVYIVSVAASSLAFPDPLLDPLAEIRILELLFCCCDSDVRNRLGINKAYSFWRHSSKEGCDSPRRTSKGSSQLHHDALTSNRACAYPQSHSLTRCEDFCRQKFQCFAK